ncbi:MAG: SDR family oxidoreductase [Gemmataceae bacterium]
MSKWKLVTGGAGFIGSHLVEALLDQGERVRVLDDFSTGLRSNLSERHPCLEIIEGDLADENSVRRAMRDVAVVFHLGALASVQKSVEEPKVTHRVCASGTLEVLDAARWAGVRRVVYAASSSAYGLPCGDLQAETEPAQPLSPYAAAKLAGELYAQAFAATYGLETVRLRFFNIFGPRQRADSPYSGVIALFLAAMTQGRRPTIFGDGLQSRDFTYVTDVVQALRQAATVPGISGKVYNVGTGRGVNLLELVAAINQLLGTELTPKHESPRPGDVRHSRADIRLAQAELGYQPEVSFPQGLAKTLEWYRAAELTVAGV